MALYLFMNSDIHKESGLFTDAVICGLFKLAPIDDYKKKSAIGYCEKNNIAIFEAEYTEVIENINSNQRVVNITSYEDAKIVYNHFNQNEEEPS